MTPSALHHETSQAYHGSPQPPPKPKPPMTNSTSKALPALLAPTIRRKPLRLTPRVQAAINLMVIEGAHRDDAALRCGINRVAMLEALKTPAIKQAYEQTVDVFRNSLKHRAVHQINHLMEDGSTERVVLDAAKVLLNDVKPGLTVNVGIQNQIAPGYLVDVGNSDVRKRQQILDSAGSTASIIDNSKG